jgi:hypothetical protein
VSLCVFLRRLPAVAQPTADTPVVAKTETVVAPAAPKVFVPNGEVFTEEIKNSNAQDHCETFG